MKIDILMKQSIKINKVEKLLKEQTTIRSNIIWGNGYNIRINNNIVEVCVFDSSVETNKMMGLLTPLLSTNLCYLYKIYNYPNECSIVANT